MLDRTYQIRKSLENHKVSTENFGNLVWTAMVGNEFTARWHVDTIYV